MALSVANVKAGTTGTVSAAVAGTALPTGSQGALNVAFTDLGYISDAGVTEAQPESSTKIKAWQNGDVVRTIRTEHDLVYTFVAIETKANVLSEFYGNYTAGKVEINGLQGLQHPWVLDVVDGLDMIRVVIPYGQLTERGDIVYQNGDVIGYPFTITAYPDPAYAGALAASAKAYKYLYDVSLGVSA